MHNNFHFKFHKMKRLISFFRNQRIVCRKRRCCCCLLQDYKQATNCTHAISWHVGDNKILDPDMTNHNVLTYTEFDPVSLECMHLLHAINTTMNDPCILYIGRWDRKDVKKRKQKHSALDSYVQKQSKN